MRILQILVLSLFCTGVRAQHIARITFPSGYGFVSVPDVGSIQFISDPQPTGLIRGPEDESVLIGFLLPVFISGTTAGPAGNLPGIRLVYPNPFEQIIHLDNRDFGPYNYQLMDMQGRRIDYGKTAEALHRIDTRLLPAGMYILRIKAADGKFELHKLVKVK